MIFNFVDCVIGYEYNGTECVSTYSKYLIIGIISCIIVITILFILTFVVMKYSKKENQNYGLLNKLKSLHG